MSEKEIQKLWSKRAKVFERLEYYQTQTERMFNTRNYNSHINRAVKRIHSINAVLVKELKIDTKRFAL
jgi:hypothetical protein